MTDYVTRDGGAVVTADVLRSLLEMRRENPLGLPDYVMDEMRYDTVGRRFLFDGSWLQRWGVESKNEPNVPDQVFDLLKRFDHNDDTREIALTLRAMAHVLENDIVRKA